ncbi:MAG: sugar phosphate isomerase/epimerase [Actinomycetota bacterium]|nr:sugar phosphate isomerase/epimerase [Actinomycetota bacterium]
MRRAMRLRHTLRAVLVAALSAVLMIGVLSTAGTAAPSKAGQGDAGCAGRGVPTSKISIQLWTFAEYIGLEDDAAAQARLEEVLSRLADMGYRNVEPFSLNGLTAEEYAALLEEHGLEASARHVDVGTPDDPSDIGQILEDNRVLGIKYFGSGGTPRLTTEAEWIAYAEYLDHVGEEARQAGQRLMVHNHNWEFQTVFGDRTAYDILMQYTDRKNVVFQLDLYWATFAGADPVELLEQYGHRIRLFHVKDLNEELGRRIEIVGRGDIDFPSIFAAADGRIRYFVVEHDPRFGDPTFDPFVAAQEGFAYLDCVTY